MWDILNSVRATMLPGGANPYQMIGIRPRDMMTTAAARKLALIPVMTLPVSSSVELR